MIAVTVSLLICELVYNWGNVLSMLNVRYLALGRPAVRVGVVGM